MKTVSVTLQDVVHLESGVVASPQSSDGGIAQSPTSESILPPSRWSVAAGLVEPEYAI